MWFAGVKLSQHCAYAPLACHAPVQLSNARFSFANTTIEAFGKTIPKGIFVYVSGAR